MKIRTKNDHERAIERIEALMDHNLTENEGAFLNGLVDAVAEYESTHWATEGPDFGDWLTHSQDGSDKKTVIKGTDVEPRHIYSRLEQGEDIEDIAMSLPEIDPIAIAAADLWFRSRLLNQTSTQAPTP
jgi:hypothetical protein